MIPATAIGIRSLKKLRPNTVRKNPQDSLYSVLESKQFLKDFEEISLWILVINSDVSEDFALKQVFKLNHEIDKLVFRLSIYPESGLDDESELGTKKFPILAGRYSIRWLIQHDNRIVILLSLLDLKYPKEL